MPTPISISGSWRTSLALDVVQLRVIETVRLLGGQVIKPDEVDVRAKFGSRISLRLWGLLTDGDLPAIMVVTVRENHGEVEVGVKLTSDEGWYLVRMKMLDDRYRTNFENKVTTLRAATV